MPSLKQKLRKALENAERVAVLGIGSELRGDDAVGLLVLEHLRKLKTKSVGCRSRRKSKIVAGVGDPGPASARPATVFGCPNRASRSGPILKLFNGGNAPENLTGEIRRFKPGHLIMIDAVDMGKKPGTIALVDLKNIKNIAFLTHKLPIKLMLDYMAAEMTFETIFIGIQPRSLEFEGKISKPVIRAGRELADLLTAILRS